MDMITPNQRFSTLLIMFFGLMILGGCLNTLELEQVVDQYHAAESKVKLGDSKEDVLAILQPTQANLSGKFKRAPEHWIDPKSGKVVDLYYFRSKVTYQLASQTRDILVTPYLFRVLSI